MTTPEELIQVLGPGFSVTVHPVDKGLYVVSLRLPAGRCREAVEIGVREDLLVCHDAREVAAYLYPQFQELARRHCSYVMPDRYFTDEDWLRTIRPFSPAGSDEEGNV